MNVRSRSTLFLIEQLIVIAIFALCAAACAKILTAAYFSAADSRDLSNALHIAESGAESFKATGGDTGKVAEILGGVSGSVDGADAAIVYYNDRWLACGEDSACYRLRLIKGAPDTGGGRPVYGELSIEKLTGEPIIALTVAAGDRGGDTV